MNWLFSCHPGCLLLATTAYDDGHGRGCLLGPYLRASWLFSSAPTSSTNCEKSGRRVTVAPMRPNCSASLINQQNSRPRKSMVSIV